MLYNLYQPVEYGWDLHVSVVLQKLIVKVNFEVFALWGDLSVFCGIVLAAPVEHKLCNICNNRNKSHYILI